MQVQFFHIETYSRGRNHGRAAHRPPRRQGWSIEDILAEAARQPGACPHVAKPQAPFFLLGTLTALQGAHDEMLIGCQMRTGRRVRRDQHTLLTIVASHPACPEDLADPVVARLVDHWQRRNLTYWQEWAERRGGHLHCAMLHLDEGRVHLHLYALPDGQAAGRAHTMHPGASARDFTIAESKARGHTAKLAVRLGHQAYRAAMRDCQTEYWQAVGAPSGLLRDGPRRRRVPRATFLAQQRALHAATMAEDAAGHALSRLDATEELRRQILQDLEAERLVIVERSASTAAASERVRIAHRAVHALYNQAREVNRVLADRHASLARRDDVIPEAKRQVDARADAATTLEKTILRREQAVEQRSVALRRRELDLAKREAEFMALSKQGKNPGAGGLIRMSSSASELIHRQRPPGVSNAPCTGRDGG